ncbi:putative major facilitator superfamily transporter [Agrobacterium rubi TR3 = NBRC 13261]|uniref:Putative major facilitator superfamily transporter n=1 Tax=Agrobacterium rubi TR3 = NBRC 13261 TaxID=1368415 RepID=A0A081CUM3_9HYPH|nr:MFS transporter [Agrobacterium rubi]MBP1879222.1 putative MFS family arabinose efflux permease [Agrobacterium rubi]MCL6652520.1 MFS transporter [Agrobacterium rubi]GAK70369.1 putative major facilitator superfamily transporter [Agrobacterium rubi TR3 = NBRC 13261]
MNPTFNPASADGSPQTPAWGAVTSMALGVFGLVTAEFLPASLLTPIAAELGITEGAAGQAVTVTAVVGMMASLLITSVAQRIDRRHLMMFFSALLVISNLMVAASPGLTMLLIGRLLLGVALGGFWAMSTAIVIRLVPPASIPRALSMIFSGVSAATIVAAPVGSYVGELAGWRSVFVLTALLGVVAFVMQFLTLPKLPATGTSSIKTLGVVLARPGIALGLAAATLVFGGHFAFFTYLRPYLEADIGAGIGMVSALLLGFGLANFIGTLLAGSLINRSLKVSLAALPLSMAVIALLIVTTHPPLPLAAVLVAAWGFLFGAVPVSWSTWLARTIPDEAESAGGLLVASIQFAIAMGAAVGGIIFDLNGATSVFATSGLILAIAAIGIILGVKPRPQVSVA